MHGWVCDPLPQSLDNPDGGEEPNAGVGGQGGQQGEQGGHQYTWVVGSRYRTVQCIMYRKVDTAQHSTVQYSTLHIK